MSGEYTDALYEELLQQLHIPCVLPNLPEGVTAHTREGGGERYLFVENYSGKVAQFEIEKKYVDVETEHIIEGTITLDIYGVKVLKEM